MSTFTAVALALALGQGPGQAPGQAPAAPAPQTAPQAQAQAAQAPVITIQEALQLAAARNLDLKVLRAQLDEANEIAWKAWAGYLPQVTVTGTYQRQRELTSTLPFGTPPLELPIQTPEVTQGQIELTQTLLSPSLAFGIRGARRTERATLLTIDNARRELLFGVASAYYAVASLKQALAVAEQLLGITQRQEKDARVRFQAGTIAKVGLLRAEIDRARAEQDLKRAQNAFASARNALATLLDRDDRFDVTDPPAPPLAAEPDRDALVRTAMEQRLDIRAARERVDAARAARDSSLWRYFPDLAGFGRYQRQNAAGALGAGHNWQAGIALRWQLLDGFRRESDIREGNARIAEAESTAASTEAKARLDVVQALLDLESARANALKAKEQRDLAAENQRLVDVSYRAGAATAVEQADATASLRNAEIGYTTESLNAQLAAVRVLRVVGEFDISR